MDNRDFSVIRKNGRLPDPRRIDASGIVSDLWEVYWDSALSGLSKLETAAINLEAGEKPEENAAIIRRVFHSLKGDSGVTGLKDIYQLCHQAEFAFEELSSSDAIDMVLTVKDWITEAITCIKDGETIKEESVECDKIKTLVIDDQPVIRRHIQLLLQDFCECVFADNGSTGLKLFEEAHEKGQPFELVTLDIEMPVMNGHAALEAIREIETQHGIMGLDGVKVIMSTSMEDTQNIFSAFKEGCEAYVKKIDMEQKLVEEVKKLGFKVPQFSAR